MPAVEGTLDLIVDPALASLERVESAASAMLEAIGSTPVNIAVEVDSASLDELSASLADLTATTITLGMEVDSEQLDSLRETLDGLTTVTVAAEVDTGQVEDLAATVAGIDGTALDVSVAVDDAALQAVDSTPVAVEVVLDPGSVDALLSELGALGDAARVVVTVELDEGSLSAVEGALAAIEAPPVVVPVDTSEVDGAVADVGALADATASVAPVDVGGGGGDLAQYGQQADQAAASTDRLGTSVDSFAAVAVGQSGAVRGALGAISPVAAAATAGLGVFFHAAFVGAAEAEQATNRFVDVFGSVADEVDHIDVGGLNTDLSTLAVTLGADDDKARLAAAGLGALGTQAGATAEEAGKVAEQFIAVASYVAATRPELGSLNDIMLRLGPSLIRGGAAASRMGLSLSSTEVAARASEIALARGSDTVNAFDKQAAALEITVRQLGSGLGEGIEKGSKQGVVQIQSFRQQVEEAVEGAGKALVDPGLELGREFFGLLAQVIGVAGDAAETFVPLLMGAAKAVGFAGTVIKPVIGLLDDIPEPLLQAAVGAYAASRALPPLVAGLGLLTGAGSRAAASLGATSIAGRLEGFSVGARNAGDLSRAKDGTARAALVLERAFATETKAAAASAVATARVSAADRASIATTSGATVAQVASARAFTAKELSAIAAAGGLGTLTVAERITAVQTAALAGDVALTNAALGSLGSKSTVTAAELTLAGAAAGRAGDATLAAGTKAAAAGVGFSKALGVIGLVVGIGAALLSVMGVFGGKTDEASASTEEWTGFLLANAEALATAEAAAIAAGDAIAAIGGEQRSAAIASLTKTIGDTAERFGEVGISVGDMYDAIQGGSGTLVGFRQRLLDANVVTIENVANTKAAREAVFAFQREYLVTGDASRAYANAVRESGGALLSAKLVGEDYANVLKTQAGASDSALDATRKRAEGEIAAGKTTEISNIKAIQGTRAWGELSVGQNRAATALLKRAAAEQVGAEATETLTAAALAEQEVLVDLARAEIRAADARKVDNVAKLVADGLLGSLTSKERAHAIALLSTASALDGNAKATEALEQIQADAEAQAEDLADAYKSIDDAVSQAADAFRAYLGIPLTALEQQVQLAEGTASVTEALKENGATLDANTEKGRANAQALGAIAEQGLDAAAAAVKQGEAVEGATAVLATYRKALVDGAVAAGVSVEQANALADSVGLIPEKAAIELAATGGEKAVEAVAALATFVEENLPETVVLRLRADGAVTVQETIDAVAKSFGKIPPEKRTRVAVDFKELLIASGKYEEFRERPDLQKILRVADESQEARDAYEVLERFPDIEKFMRVDPETADAVREYNYVDALAHIQKRFRLDDSEIEAVKRNYREFQFVRDVNKSVFLDGRDVIRARDEYDTLAARPNIEKSLKVETTVTASVVTVKVGPGGQLLAEGGIIDEYGNERFAVGGEKHEAFVARANSGVRIFNEPETGGEAYVPLALAKRPRSAAILADVADRFGYRLTPANVRAARLHVTADVRGDEIVGAAHDFSRSARAIERAARSLAEASRRPAQTHVDQRKTVNISIPQRATADDRFAAEVARAIR